MEKQAVQAVATAASAASSVVGAAVASIASSVTATPAATAAATAAATHAAATARPRLTYANKLILAPMVRIGTMPMRLMALKYGADIVYSPELVDQRLMKCTRVENNELGTIDYMDAGGKLTLRIHPSERGRLVVQLGSANADYAVRAAKNVEADVDGIDLNCGCPKKFSTSGGMGAALLDTPDVLESILRALIAAVSVPVTCKIRLLPAGDGKTSIERTVELVQRLERTGIAAIGVHARYVHERPRDKAHWCVFDAIAAAVRIPVIANGDLWNPADIQRLRSTTGSGVSSFMIARGAQDNVSVFRKEGPLPVYDIMQEYLRLAEKYQMGFAAIKYVLMHMWDAPEAHPFRERMARCKSIPAFYALFEEYKDCHGLIDEPNGAIANAPASATASASATANGRVHTPPVPDPDEEGHTHKAARPLPSTDE